MPILGATVVGAGERTFGAGDVLDEIALARLVEEAGDSRLAARLADPRPRQDALIAARASAYAHAPEALVPALAVLACGRDPALAPAAAQALLAIAERLDPAELAMREVLKTDLVTARRALSCAEREPDTRADIVLALAATATALDAVLR